ncbi:MAG: homoserine dehydrogenase [Gammaproteobacteria bacterium]|nr:MAG: homoserine dehydrogenase [Gammaproteobacteria bacterium]RLA14680.1 MAG: homoserine dehydrogenase [Gammaproteobacteria bacterium]RLA15276.1 MAG: homoserine dehydrogenase [Gammaproteobacteria bacterium]
MKPVNIGIIGLGTVGCATVEILKANAADIADRVGRPVVVSHACVRDPSKPRSCDLSSVELLKDTADLVNHPDIDIVVELMGGTDLALDLGLQAVAAGKHLVTANKALIAEHGNQLFAAAQANGVTVAYEAAVAGGIPIIKAIREGLAGNRIHSVAGIINGTGNFILSEMRDKGRAFDDVLREAQELGYAEADPTFDVEGIDAAHKLTILASIAFGIPLNFPAVFTEGISTVTAEDVTNAEKLGYRIKHLGIAEQTESGVSLRVHPTLIPQTQLLANVHGVMNAVQVQSDAVGESLYYGAGAGGGPTGSAVVADILDIARALTATPEQRVPFLGFQPERLKNIPLLTIEAVESAYYLRMRAADQPGVMAEVTGILGQFGISIEAIEQTEPVQHDTQATIIMLTHRVIEQKMVEAIKQIEALQTIVGAVTMIRVEHFNTRQST